MHLATLTNNPSPLAGEGRVRGVLGSDIHPHPGPLPPWERGKVTNHRLLRGLRCQVHRSEEKNTQCHHP